MIIILLKYFLAAILIILGFIALLRQKTYIDSKTKQPTEIEITKLGKFKSNYPALAFVVLGFVLAFFVGSIPSTSICMTRSK